MKVFIIQNLSFIQRSFHPAQVASWFSVVVRIVAGGIYEK